MSSPEFLEKLNKLSREELLEILKIQDPELMKQVNRIEWVFENKMSHLSWDDGSPIKGRPLTVEQLALLIDEPFEPRRDLTELGLTVADQRQLHVSKDPILWAKHYLGVKPRAYQIMIIRHPNNRKVLRAGRRLGKTWSMSILLLHYAFTHNDGKCLVVAPMKSHVGLIYDEIIKIASKSEAVNDAIIRKVTSPQYEIKMSNNSTIRFFTSGMRSGGKADVVRGQEAHMIVLDELDYMHNDDLESLYAMLQQTDEGQDEKLLVGASTPTGRRENFWKWCRGTRFTEFWFPSYVNPFFTLTNEEEYREQYGEMGYRHEIEADWGEDSEGVYPRRYVDHAFSCAADFLPEDTPYEEVQAASNWEYKEDIQSARSFFIMGVDWDKYGAGTNLVIIECCDSNYEDPRFAGRTRLVYREEINKEEYTLTSAVDRIIELNEIFKPRHIYVDRGFGEVQVEILHKYGVEHPASGLRKKVVGVQFSETLEMRDPATREMVKKDIKPFMVDNLRQMLERGTICFPSSDEELYLQLISYIVVRTTTVGRPVFEATGNHGDHAHDALILACYAIERHYGDLMKQRFAQKGMAISAASLSPLINLGPIDEPTPVALEIPTSAPYAVKRSMTVGMSSRRPGSGIKRKSF